MKKKNKLMILSLLATTLFTGNVHADQFATEGELVTTEGGTSSHTALVGTVETPVYDVHVEWENLIFDWSFDSESGLYGWTTAKQCLEVVYSNEYATPGQLYYTDSNCETMIFDNALVEGTHYYSIIEIVPAYVRIVDKSTGVNMIPSISWSPATKYNYTTATYYGTYDRCELVNPTDILEQHSYLINSDCSGEAVEKNNLAGRDAYQIVENNKYFTNGEIPSEIRSFMGHAEDGIAAYDYLFNIELHVDNTKNVTTPSAGDTIGTFTITIGTEE